MLTPTLATTLIDELCDFETVEKLLSTLGFTAPPLPLDGTALISLGVDAVVTHASVSAGEGALRALAVELRTGYPIRDTLDLIARRVSNRAPHLVWLVVATASDSNTVAIATWRYEGSHPLLFALITERNRVTESDAETLCALAACSSCAPDTLRHLRWCDVLGREEITRRFFRALEGSVKELASSLPSTIPAADRDQLSLTLSSRMLFLSFLETKGWLNRDYAFLANGFADCISGGGSYHAKVLDPLFFGTLNTQVGKRARRAVAFGSVPFLNGGLFSRTHTERIHRGARFTDEAIGNLFGNVLVRYRFTAREDAGTWSQAAVNPEMLGKAFESLMARDERKRSGVFYTPQALVERIVRTTFEESLAARIGSCSLDAILSGDPLPQTIRAALLKTTSAIRILDPACGSGAFLVNALELLTALRLAAGDARSVARIRHDMVTRSIFGVDINPTAVWLCQLRLWLSVVIDSDERDPTRVMPLPNLDRQIRIGDSLSGAAFCDSARHTIGSRDLQRVRRRYAASTGARKALLARDLDRRERQCALAVTDRAIDAAVAERREIICAARSPDLFRVTVGSTPAARARLRSLRASVRGLRRRRSSLQAGAALPFAYATHFADVAASGGFDAIVGNPPWVRPKHITSEARESYADTFEVCRNAAWRDGAEESCAGNGFSAQVDLAALFVERSVHLTAHHGAIGLLLPSKLFRSLAGGGLRKLLLERTSIVHAHDISDEHPAFDAAAYPAFVVARRSAFGARAAATDTDEKQPRAEVTVAVSRSGVASQWRDSPHALPLDASPGSPWLLLPPRVRAAFDAIIAHGTPLFRTSFGRPWLGVKTGCNDAFIVEQVSSDAGLTHVRRHERTGSIEASMLRPLVRGETLTRWRIARPTEHIVWTEQGGRPLTQLPPLARAWLEPSRPMLERRVDARNTKRWWSLFRTDIAASELPRVVWCDFGRTPRAAFVPARDPLVPLNTCYAVRARTDTDALALTALINTPLAAAWLAALAEPARGGYHRYLGWTMARFPVPANWKRARIALAAAADRAMGGEPPEPQELVALACDSYDINPTAVEPLLEWFG